MINKIKNLLLNWRDKIKKQIDTIRNMERKKLVFLAIRTILIVFGVGLLGVVALFAWYSKDLPTPNQVVRQEGYASRIYDRNGELLYDVFRDAKRTPVKWEDIPDGLKKATIAVEDKEFYKHNGFDPLAPLRIIKNVFYFRKLTGGSTLTQQLVKNVLLTSERSVTRKLKEFILAVQIEAKYSKDEILMMYLNESPYGGTAWGVGAAAEQYYGKQVKDLTLTESVILAGLPQSPSRYSPFSKTAGYLARSEHVLERMVEDGYVSSEQAKDTLNEIKNYKFYDNQSKIKAPHFVFWIKEELAKKYGEDLVEGGGLKITTSLDWKLQEEAEKVIADEIDKAESKGISNGAALVLDPQTGQVLAMVGSRGYFSDKTDGKFNVVTQALRQPGSSIKPVTYLTAIRKGWTAASLIMDTPVTFPGVGTKDYSPQNYNGKFNGPMNIRNALGNSINTTAVKMLANVGLANMLQQAYDMGLTTLEPTKENLSKFGLAVTLGGGEVRMIELAQAYSAFANGGYKNEIIGVLKVEDREGRVLEEYKQVPGKQVMSPQEAFIISHILSDNSAREITFGSVNGLVIPNYQVAVKTGTTNDKRDNWAIGWTPSLLTTVWVGNNDYSPMKSVASGVSGATPIWKRIMQFGVSKRPKQDFSVPNSIISMEVDKISGYASHDGFASRTEYFIDGTQPKNNDPIHLKVKVCKDKSGLATPEDVQNGSYDEKEFFKFQEEDVVSKDGVNRWQEGIEKWILEQSNPDMYRPPSDYCRLGGTVVLSFDNPSDRSTVGNNFTVKLGYTSLKKVTEAKLWVNGQEKKSWTEKPYEVDLNLADGKYELKAKITDKDGNVSEKTINIGVNIPWDYSPSPTPQASNTPSPTPLVTIIPSGT